MKKSFTLIELMVAVGILILIAASAAPSLSKERQRMNMDAVTKQVQDAIIQTQNYALAPQDPAAKHYYFILQLGSNSFHGIPIGSHEYAIIWSDKAGTAFKLVKKGQLSSSVKISSVDNANDGYYTSTEKLFKIQFRVPDALAGCSMCYFDSPFPCEWAQKTHTVTGVIHAGCDASTNPFAELQFKAGNQDKKVRVNKMTGITEMCLCTNSSCTTCNPV